MLAPVISFNIDTQEAGEVFVAQSPDIESFYPINPPIDATLNGKYLFFYSDYTRNGERKPQMEAHYSKGLLEGTIKVWSNDGSLYCEGSYNQNKKAGDWTFYYANGNIKEQGTYDINLDNSFSKLDDLITPFIELSYFDYGFEHASTQEIQSAGIIPLLNVGLNREEARTGLWKFFNKEGELTQERQY